MKMSFEGELIFVGIDVHKSSWKVTVRFCSRELKTFSCDPSAESLFTAVNRLCPGAVFHTVYEAGFTGFSTHRKLEKNGFINIVVNPADIPLGDKERKAKSDTRDSRTLAKKLESGDLKGIYVPNREQEHLRSVARLRGSLKKDKRRIMNQIRSLFYTKSVTLDKNIWSKEKLKELRQKVIGRAVETAVTIMLDHIEFINEQIKKVSAELTRLIEVYKKEQVKQILETVPGVGPITSEALITEVISPERFENDDHLCSYIGLIPDTRSTGGKDMPTGLTNRRNGRLRNVIIEAAWVASKKDPELVLAFSNLVKRMKPSEAIIRIAKKLVRRIRHIWLKMEPYKIAVNM